MERTLLNDLRMSLEEFATKKVTDILSLMQEAADELERLSNGIGAKRGQWIEFKAPYYINAPEAGVKVLVEYMTKDGLKYCTGFRDVVNGAGMWALDSQYARDCIVKRWRYITT